MKGWTASVNGRSVPITTINGVYQRVDVPAGAASVRFSFRPPHELLAFAVFVLALAFIALSLYDERRALLRPRRRATRALPRHRA
jgi:uncharacterized membrane protein YfhO